MLFAAHASSSRFPVECGTFEPKGWGASVVPLYCSGLTQQACSVNHLSGAGGAQRVRGVASGAPAQRAQISLSFGLGNEVHAGRSTEACSIHGVQQTAAGTAMCEHSSRQSFAQVGPRSDQACIGFWRSGPAQRRGNFTAAGWLHRTWDRCFFLSKADPACLPSRSVVKVGRSRVRQGVVEALPVAGLAARHVQLHRVDKSRAQCRVYAQLIFLHLTQRLFSVS